MSCSSCCPETAGDPVILRAAEPSQEEHNGSWACCVLLQNGPCSAWQLGTKTLGVLVTREDSADLTPITEDSSCLRACWFYVQWSGLFEGRWMPGSEGLSWTPCCSNDLSWEVHSGRGHPTSDPYPRGHGSVGQV